MFYRIRIAQDYPFTYGYALVEADNIRTARNLAIEHFINVEKATELELVQAGREGWPIIGGAASVVDDGRQDLLLVDSDFASTTGTLHERCSLPAPHAQTADTGEANPTFKFSGLTHENDQDVSPGTGEATTCFTPSTGSAPAWLPQPTASEDLQADIDHAVEAARDGIGADHGP